MDDAPNTAVGDLLALLDRIPFVSTLKREVQSLRRVVYRRRAPRVAVLGATPDLRARWVGSLLGDDRLEARQAAGWTDVQISGRTLRWLDLWPLGGAPAAGEEPEARGAGGREPRVEPWRDAATLAPLLDEAAPDLLIVLATPTEVDDGLSETGRLLEALREAWRERDDQLEVLAVLTGIDRMLEAEPTSAQAATLQVLEQRLRAQLRERAGREPRLLERDAGPPTVETLSDAIVEALPEEARIEAARALVHARAGREQVARGIVRSCSALAIAVALMPLPLSDLTIIGPLQVLMVTSVAYVSGREWDRGTAVEWIGSVGLVSGAGLGLRWTAQQLVKIIPGAGSIVSASIAGGGTTVLGRSAMAYFLKTEEGAEAA